MNCVAGLQPVTCRARGRERGIDNAASKTHVHIWLGVCFLTIEMHSLGGNIGKCQYSGSGSHKDLVGFSFATALAEWKTLMLLRKKHELQHFFLDRSFTLDTAKQIKQVVTALLSNQCGTAQRCLWLTRTVNDI